MEIEKKGEARLYVSVAGGRLTNPTPPHTIFSLAYKRQRGSCDSGGATIAKAGKFEKKMNKKKNLFFLSFEIIRVMEKKLRGSFYLFKKEEEKEAKGYGPFCSNRKEIEEEDLISSCVHKRSRHK